MKTVADDVISINLRSFNEDKGSLIPIESGIDCLIDIVIAMDVSGSTGTPDYTPMQFDINGNEDSFLVAKKNRTSNKYQVRPIRLLRCDGQYATGGSQHDLLWSLPKVLRDADKGINT